MLIRCTSQGFTSYMQLQIKCVCMQKTLLSSEQQQPKQILKGKKPKKNKSFKKKTEWYSPSPQVSSTSKIVQQDKVVG